MPLPHAVPPWIDPSREIYFITICCIPKGENQLAKLDISNRLFETVLHRQQRGIWWPRIFLLMPDHLHALLSFPPGAKNFRKDISKWKEWTAKTIDIKWQADFFEHRLRNFESEQVKAEYILENPIRRGLVTRWQDWPFVYFADRASPHSDPPPRTTR